ncbi:hypothetical protein BO94DRAFT_542566 [Aspergillus sclerotioniger CBS 115572]|uniref:Uncharacterized protein n=1 Tax=Aspergillus sclerotioniger CBS 115572 TaxID=1450535 RepID=A0A317X9Q5_9EURO|nr:hypothetical protein BO94DRAFT_542566 [Aspergillus sclerotioniger CBS 115572]PWY95316.1 hypothetical protein BO94DRAFT_542566 [Aspergillus sclerotioniger CBS 115572]
MTQKDTYSVCIPRRTTVPLYYTPYIHTVPRMKSSRKALWPTITDRTHIIHLDQWPAPTTLAGSCSPGGPAAPIRNPPALPDANSHSGPSPRNAPAYRWPMVFRRGTDVSSPFPPPESYPIVPYRHHRLNPEHDWRLDSPGVPRPEVLFASPPGACPLTP